MPSGTEPVTGGTRGIGGVQTRPFILHPPNLEALAAPTVGAASVHGVLKGWRHALQREPAALKPARAYRNPDETRRPSETEPMVRPAE